MVRRACSLGRKGLYPLRDFALCPPPPLVTECREPARRGTYELPGPQSPSHDSGSCFPSFLSYGFRRLGVPVGNRRVSCDFSFLWFSIFLRVARFPPPSGFYKYYCRFNYLPLNFRILQPTPMSCNSTFGFFPHAKFLAMPCY